MPLLRSCRWLLALFPCAVTGCAALSLFSTTHQHHYEGSTEIEQRVESLEHRVMALEQGTPGPSLSTWKPVNGSPLAPGEVREVGGRSQVRSQTPDPALMDEDPISFPVPGYPDARFRYLVYRNFEPSPAIFRPLSAESDVSYEPLADRWPIRQSKDSRQP